MSQPWLVALIVFVLAIALAATLISKLEENRRVLLRENVSRQASDHAHALRQHIERNLSAAYTLAALVRHGHGAFSDFDTVAGQMLPFYPGVASLQLAPDGIVRHIVPLAGNEAAIGHNLLQDPMRNKEAFIARDTGKLTLAGPFTLLQGGEGVVGRLPVFLDQDHGRPTFWGFVAVLMRFPDVLVGVRLPDLAEQGISYELWRINTASGQRQVLAASGASPLIEPIESVVELPHGNWTLSAAPAKGWNDPLGLSLKAALGLSFSLLLAFLTKLLSDSKTQQQRLETEVARRTAEILATQRQLQATLAAIPDLMFEVGLEGRISDIHSSRTDLLALPVEKILGRLMSDFISPDSVAATLAGLHEALERGNASGIQIQIPLAEGRRWFECSIARKEVAAGQEARFIVIARDIAERKDAEATLQDSRERLQRLLDSMAEGAYGVDTRGICTFVNRVFLDMLGFHNPDEVLGQHIHRLIHHSHADGSPYPASECRMYGAFVAGQSIQVSDEVFWRADGTSVPVAYWSNPVLSNGEVVGAICTFSDITERKLAEQKILAQLDELLRWQRLTIGREERMLQLKAEVNELLARQGQPARYPGQAD